MALFLDRSRGATLPHVRGGADPVAGRPVRSVRRRGAVLTNDTDLVEPVRIVTQELGLQVTLLTPITKPATSLARLATGVRHVQPYIGPCQLPDPILVPGRKPISKPVEWR
jgi:hypothetical protein